MASHPPTPLPARPRLRRLDLQIPPRDRQIITAARASDASGGSESHPIPFINAVDRVPYAHFTYSSSADAAFDLGFDVGCRCEGGACEGCACAEGVGFGLKRECGRGCRCGSGCGNRETQGGVGARLRVVRDPRKGWGLHVAEFVREGRFVCEYSGEYVTNEEAKRRLMEYDELTSGGQFSHALLVVREHLPSRRACLRVNIDATRIGNVARFINHSCDGGNLTLILVRNTGSLIPRLCFFASRDIKEGEEITFSYGDVRLRPDGPPCHCGSTGCFGVLPSEQT
ncbi:Histone-lysine N-methyltransferase SUVR3 [Acorus calamus]|uniref:Histone-lysine N-methyltransferase SUVR3 n=1 Tax=Acorus calamus TaxID=4465 RepID=A0AAV9D6N6_ACOCL|nr:Histone-lysine N-methyltransferase SUVR3 [Acorus calamus]